MYEIYNNIDDIIIFVGNEKEFIDFVKLIVIENEQEDFSILGVSDAVDYIENYCDNLNLN